VRYLRSPINCGPFPQNLLQVSWGTTTVQAGHRWPGHHLWNNANPQTHMPRKVSSLSSKKRENTSRQVLEVTWHYKTWCQKVPLTPLNNIYVQGVQFGVRYSDGQRLVVATGVKKFVKSVCPRRELIAVWIRLGVNFSIFRLFIGVSSFLIRVEIFHFPRTC